MPVNLKLALAALWWQLHSVAHAVLQLSCVCMCKMEKKKRKMIEIKWMEWKKRGTTFWWQIFELGHFFGYLENRTQIYPWAAGITLFKCAAFWQSDCSTSCVNYFLKTKQNKRTITIALPFLLAIHKIHTQRVMIIWLSAFDILTFLILSRSA